VILSPLETVLLWTFIIFYSLILFIGWKVYRNSAKGRKKTLSYLFLLNLAVFYLGSISVHLWLNNKEPNLQDFVTVYGLLTIGVYVASIEVPGFLILSHYDEKSIGVLRIAREHLITSTFDFLPSIQSLQTLVNKHKSRLEELHLFANLSYFVQSSNQMKHINRSVLDLLLIEINQSVRSVSQKSKHPFPKLIDVLSLTGLSFLFAQLLR
jgi:hypothetical protein